MAWTRSASTRPKRSPQIRAEVAPGGELIAGYVGRLATEKRVDLLAGITALDGVRLVIVGAGPAEVAGRAAAGCPGGIGPDHAALDRRVGPRAGRARGHGLARERHGAAEADPAGSAAVPGRGWAALLASTLPQPELHNLATLGALAADVERAQLPAAKALRPDVASVVIGINDTLRGDFDPERTGQSVDRTVAALRAAGAEVLTVRLPDPGQMFGLPGALARPLARRMRAVNAAVDEVARRYGTVHLDVARDPATYERRYWSVDRLHPNERGQIRQWSA